MCSVARPPLPTINQWNVYILVNNICNKEQFIAASVSAQKCDCNFGWDFVWSKRRPSVKNNLPMSSKWCVCVQFQQYCRSDWPLVCIYCEWFMWDKVTRRTTSKYFFFKCNFLRIETFARTDPRLSEPFSPETDFHVLIKRKELMECCQHTGIHV